MVKTPIVEAVLHFTQSFSTDAFVLVYRVLCFIFLNVKTQDKRFPVILTPSTLRKDRRTRADRPFLRVAHRC